MTALQTVKKAINLGYNNLGREKLDWVRKSSVLVDVIAWPSKRKEMDLGWNVFFLKSRQIFLVHHYFQH